MASQPQTKPASQSDNFNNEFARLALEKGLVTRKELDYVQDHQNKNTELSQRSVADLLVECNFLTPYQAKRVKQDIKDAHSQNSIPGYDLISELGRGAMATVFKARQRSLDRIVAIKVLPKRMSQNAEFVDRFQKEGKAAARLAHNNIVQAIDVGCAPNGYHYFVMEYIEGLTLYDIMQKGKVFSEQEVLDIGYQMADALAHAHARNLIHRDVKPKNIILTPDGVAKLTDLGLARAQDDVELAEREAGKAYGTPYYISPEQIRGEIDIDFRADIYSLGATLYHLLTGRPPFEGDSPSAVMHKHLKQPLVPVDHINTSLSSGIGEIIDVSMAKRREERYQTTEDMLEDLSLVRAGQPPTHARRMVDLDGIAKIEETGKTVDIEISSEKKSPQRPPGAVSMNIILLATGAAVSFVMNVVLLILYFTKK